MSITTREVARLLRAEVNPLIRAQGFAMARGKTFWRHGPVLTDVIRLGHLTAHVARVARVSAASIQVEFGTGLTRAMAGHVRRKDRLPCPDPWDCLFRGAAQKALRQPQLDQGDIWVIEAGGSNLDAVIADIARVIRDDAPAWFARVHDLTAMQRFLETEEEAEDFSLWGFGRPASPARREALALVAQALQEVALQEASLPDRAPQTAASEKHAPKAGG